MNEQDGIAADLSFEDALRQLEEIVRKLEDGDVPLDQSIDLYARGDRLRAHCQKRLDAAQARIEKIRVGADGNAIGTEAFDAG
ncbi:MAG: exodeoxyribonuclease VII small subunit [Blastomonas sp.]